LGSIAITSKAPSARTTPTANMPIGPHPITATEFVAMSSPQQSERRVRTAFLNGSMIEATSGSPSPTTHAFWAEHDGSANALVSTPGSEFSQMRA
jgi:hypothetical protein